MEYPHLFTLTNGTPFAFAAVWEPAQGPFAESVAILTTAPNRLAAAVHSRMPVVLPPDDRMERWLGSDPLPDGEFEALTAPLADGLLQEREVNRFASNSRNEGPKCIAPPDPPAVDPRLGLL